MKGDNIVQKEYSQNHQNIKVTEKVVIPGSCYFEIDNGASVYRIMRARSEGMRQDDLAEFYEKEKEKGNPLPMNSIQVWQTLDDAVRSGDRCLINFLERSLRNTARCGPDPIITTTRILNNPRGQEDEVIHNYGTSDAYSLKGNIADLRFFPDDIVDLDLSGLALLLKSEDVKRINEISETINRSRMDIFTKSKPDKTMPTVAGFRVYGPSLYELGRNLFFLDCKIDPDKWGRAFLMTLLRTGAKH